MCHKKTSLMISTKLFYVHSCNTLLRCVPEGDNKGSVLVIVKIPPEQKKISLRNKKTWTQFQTVFTIYFEQNNKNFFFSSGNICLYIFLWRINKSPVYFLLVTDKKKKVLFFVSSTQLINEVDESSTHNWLSLKKTKKNSLLYFFLLAELLFIIFCFYFLL